MLNLKKLSKKALEAIGRDKGIELDRRLKKDKLVEQLQNALDAEQNTTLVDLKAEAVEENAQEVIEGWDYENNRWDRSHPVGRQKWGEEFFARHPSNHGRK